MKSLIVLLVVILIGSCCSFEPVQIKGQPDECNDMFSGMRLIIMEENKDNALVVTFQTECKKARDYKRKVNIWNKCKLEYYPDNIINSSDLKKYRDFKDCIDNFK